MSIAKIIELSSESNQSFEDAIRSGLVRAESTLRNVTGAWISEQKIDVKNGKPIMFRVDMKVTYVLD